MNDVAVRTTELRKSYGSLIALSGLTLALERGEVYGLLGPNGAGKTTAVKLLLGLTRPSSGSGEVLGRPLGDIESRRRIGYLPELFRYPTWLSGREVLALHSRLLGLPRRDDRREHDRCLELAGIAAAAGRRVGTFSKGMQQRLGLAVAMLGTPQLVILDEPTSALDPIGRHDVRVIIRELAAAGTTVVLNSHLLSEVERVCDRVAIVKAGRVLVQGTMGEVLDTPPAVRLRVEGVADAVLAGFGAVSHEDGGAIVVRLAHDRIPDLVAALVAAGGRVAAVEPLHGDLEERFLSLIGTAP